MNLSKFKNILLNSKEISFQLENGEIIPQHFHITEIGINSKEYIDCGGTIRLEKVINFQLWHANDFDHKLETKKVLEIISLAEKALFIEDLDIEVEYQSSTIGKYNLGFNGISFVLESKTTACLAEDKCGIPEEKINVSLSDLQNNSSPCSPESGCC
tara:strand:+ start:1181 stop:1651 length:471 start_codon:yes stop_codon:yes gene_type:complete